jgi:hypothetical protein
MSDTGPPQPLRVFVGHLKLARQGLLGRQIDVEWMVRKPEINYFRINYGWPPLPCETTCSLHGCVLYSRKIFLGSFADFGL